MKKNKLENILNYDIADEIKNNSEKNEFVDFKSFSYENCTLYKTTVLNDKNIFNKKKGIYYALEFDTLKDKKIYDEVDLILQKTINKLIKLKIKTRKKKILVVGLGNETYSPDSLGPRVAKEINTTYFLENEYNNLVATFVPLVKGITGLETFDIISSITKSHRFDLILCIDSLATTSLERLNKVIQITDTGIVPGSGINNYRKELSEKTLGIPLIVIGVGTVISLNAIIYDLLASMNVQEMNEEMKKKLELNMVFALKDVDKQIEYLTKLIAHSLNMIFNPSLVSSFDN